MLRGVEQHLKNAEDDMGAKEGSSVSKAVNLVSLGWEFCVTRCCTGSIRDSTRLHGHGARIRRGTWFALFITSISVFLTMKHSPAV